MSAFTVEHEFGGGLLKIQLDPNLSDWSLDKFEFTFSCDERKIRYVGSRTRQELWSACSVLSKSEELMEMLNHRPAVSLGDLIANVSFNNVGKNGESVYVKMLDVSANAEAIANLIQENYDLKTQIAVQNARIASLEKSISESAHKMRAPQANNASLEDRISKLEAQIVSMQREYEGAPAAVSVIAHYLLNANGGNDQYSDHLEKFPDMIHDVDAYRKFDAWRNRSILTDSTHEPLFKAMIDAKIFQPLIDMVFELDEDDIMSSSKSTIISNIKLLIKSLDSSRLRSSNNVHMIEFVNEQCQKHDIRHAAKHGWLTIQQLLNESSSHF